jgi:hypothetical protein
MLLSERIQAEKPTSGVILGETVLRAAHLIDQLFEDRPELTKHSDNQKLKQQLHTLLLKLS